MERRELFDTNYSYYERVTEIEAYRFAVDEARRLGISDERICEYLKVLWMGSKDFEKLTKVLCIKYKF